MPELLQEYNDIISDQLREGVVEAVTDLEPLAQSKVHYLPHHSVIRPDKSTSRVRIVYDATCRSDGPSLNDCLHSGPNFGWCILDIVIQFRV